MEELVVVLKSYNRIFSECNIIVKLNGKNIAFSYPNGDVGDREVKAVENAGYKIAFTTKPTVIDTTNPGNMPLIPRKSINTLRGKYENLAKIIGIWQKALPKPEPNV